MRLFSLCPELTVCSREHPVYTGPSRRDGSGHREMVVDFPKNAVAGARRSPGRLKTGGVPPKPPATILLSLSPSVVQDVAASFLTRCCSRIFVRVAAATSASCRGTSQQSITLQMFLQLQTLRRHVSRPVAAGVSLSLHDVAASQYVCSCGAAALSSPVSSFGSGYRCC